MRVKFTFLALFVGIVSVFAQTNVLFLGNSYTYTYNTDQLFKGMAQAAGENVYVEIVANPGQEIEGASGHAASQQSIDAINSRQWDFVVVQDNQGRWVWPGNPVGIAASTGNAWVSLINTIKANNSCSNIVYFAGWSIEGGATGGSATTESEIDVIYANHVNFNIEAQAYQLVAPIGKCWSKSLQQYPSVDLFHSDRAHPSLEGSYLSAASIFVSIFKTDPQPLNYSGGLSPTVATNMRKIAWDIQMQTTPDDIFTQTQMSYNSPSLVYSGGVLTAGNGFNQYRWYLNGTLLNGGAVSTTHTPTQSGKYRAEGEWNNCWFISFEVEVTAVGVEENEVADNIGVYPNPTTGSINLTNVADVNEVTITSVTGEVVLTQISNNTSEMIIDLSTFVEGVYFVKLISEGNVITKRVLLTK